jgi:hypothetical protein
MTQAPTILDQLTAEKFEHFFTIANFPVEQFATEVSALATSCANPEFKAFLFAGYKNFCEQIAVHRADMQVELAFRVMAGILIGLKYAQAQLELAELSKLS